MRRSGRPLGQSLAAMVPALVLGMAAGVTGGAWAAGELDTTPYGETDFNTVARDARQEGQALGRQQAEEVSAVATSKLRTSHEQQLGDVKSDLSRVRRELVKQRRSARKQRKELEQRGTRLAQLESGLAETTAALDNATSSAAGAGADGVAVEGTLRSTWKLGKQDKPWPQDCSKPLSRYAIRITAGADATVATAELVDSEVVRRSEKKNSLTLTCSMTYSTHLPAPLGSSYRFVVLEAGKGDAAQATGQASEDALRAGTGPRLSVSS